MRYCGIAPVGARHLQLVVVEEVREPVPPIRLAASFFEPGSAAEVASQLRLWAGELAVALGAPLGSTAGERSCDRMLEDLGVLPSPPAPEAVALVAELAELEHLEFEEEGSGAVPEGTFRTAPLVETSADAVFCALQGRRLPARRHPLGMQLRIEELEAAQVVDDGGDLWHRRIEEVDAAAAALLAHRYAVGHASWLGGPDGVVVLPGSAPAEPFPTHGVLPPVERVPLAGS